MDTIAKQPDGTEDAVHRGRLSDVRLARGHTLTPNEGFVQVLYSNQWQFVCSRYWSFKLSNMTCHSLGYTTALLPSDGQIAYRAEAVAEEIPGILRLVCQRSTRNLTECGVRPITIDTRFMCEDNGIAMVTCEKKDEALVCGPEGEPLGISSGIIPDSAITKSSCDASLDCDSTAGRLHSYATWKPAVYDYSSPWIQISLESLHLVTGVVTQSHHSLDISMTSYTVSFRLDSDTWSPYRNVYTNSYSTVFQSNFRGTTPVEHSFHPPLMARFIRLHPRTYVGSPSLRFELIGYGPLADYIGEIYEPNLRCAPPLGKRLGVTNSSIIPDSSFSSSGALNNYFKPFNARLFGNGVWAPSQTTSPWLQVDLGNVYQVTGVMTQGRPPLPAYGDQHQWTTSYTLSLAIDSGTWVGVSEEHCGFLKEFPANFDGGTPVTNLLPSPLSAQYVKIFPIAYHGYPFLRCEILGF